MKLLGVAAGLLKLLQSRGEVSANGGHVRLLLPGAGCEVDAVPVRNLAHLFIWKPQKVTSCNVN